MFEFRTASKGRKEHPKVIMPEEKDKIVHELLNKEGNSFSALLALYLLIISIGILSMSIDRLYFI